MSAATRTGLAPSVRQGLFVILCMLLLGMVSREEVAEALEDVRPHLKTEGGDIELVDVEDGTVKVRLKGACAGCPMSQMTLKWGVENYLKKKLSGVKKVEAVET
ncbi:MAG: NifU family protein [Candidatus Bathyarchaeia archaeon]